MAEAAEAAGLDAAAADADGDAAAAAGEPGEQAGEPAEAAAAPVPAPVDAPQLQQAKSELAADDEGAADWELGLEDLELDLTDHCEAGLEPGSGSGGQRCPELKRCNVCLRDLPLAQYPQNRDGSVRGATCTVDSDAGECLQRLLRRAWGPLYKQRYDAFKHDKPKWREVVLSLVLNSGGRGKKRKIAAAIHSLGLKKFKTEQEVRKQISTPMTWPAFKIHFGKAEHGGYTNDQLMKWWQDMRKPDSGIERDKEGVVEGVPNQFQLWVPVRKEKHSETVTGEERSRVSKGKDSKQALDPEDENGFLDGSIEFDSSCPEDLREALLLARSIDEAMGFPLTQVPGSSCSGSGTASVLGEAASTASTAPTSSEKSLSRAAASLAPSPDKLSDPKWTRDSKAKIDEAQSFCRDKVAELNTLLVESNAKIPAIRKEVRGCSRGMKPASASTQQIF